MWGTLCTLAVPVRAQEASTTTPPTTITTLRGDLYRVQGGSETTVFLVTPEGIVLSDPLDRATATALQAELKARFPDRPVRHVVLTQHRFDRAEGAVRFSTTATLTAHANFNRELERARQHLAPALADLDRNGSGELESEELIRDARGVRLATYDTDTDGRVTPGELYAYVAPVKSTFTARGTLTLGGQTVQLVYPGPAYAADAVVLYFPADRVVFAAAAPEPTQAFSFGSSRPVDVIRWVQTITAIDFDTLVTGDGRTITRSDLVALQKYLDELFAGVVTGYEAGRSLMEVQSSTVLDAHTTAPYYAQRRTHIENVYRGIRVRRINVYGAAIATHTPIGADFCDEFTACDWESGSLAQTIGFSLTRRRIIVAAEVTLAGERIGSRLSRLYDDGFASRESTLAILAGYGSPPNRAVSFNLIGGGSFQKVDVQGIAREKFALTPLGGRRLFEDDWSRVALTGGADLIFSLTNRLELMVPIRLSRAIDQRRDRSPGLFSTQAGIGLRYRLQQRVD